MRHVALGLLLTLTTMAVAAPVPKQLINESTAEKLFGTPTVPKVCSFSLNKSDRSLSITAVPGPDVAGNGSGEDGLFWSPRTGREVDGDFDVSVKITLPDQADTAVAAGVYVSYGEKDFVVLSEKLEPGGRGKIDRGGFFHAHINGRLWNAQGGGNPEDGPNEYGVRLTRKGKTVTPYQLSNGKWEAIFQMDTTHDWPGKGTVGVYVRALKGDGTATFRDFKLMMPEK